MEFQRDGNRLYKTDEGGETVAEIAFPEIGEGVVDINHTFVADSLRGQGIAGGLVETAYGIIKEEGKRAALTCPYAIKWFEEHPEKNDIVTQAQ